MANNRMYLLHSPSGYYVMLGKRMGWGWYKAPSQDDIQNLFDKVYTQEAEGDQDEFVVAFEGDRRLKTNVKETEMISFNISREQASELKVGLENYMRMYEKGKKTDEEFYRSNQTDWHIITVGAIYRNLLNAMKEE